MKLRKTWINRIKTIWMRQNILIECHPNGTFILSNGKEIETGKKTFSEITKKLRAHGIKYTSESLIQVYGI